jgi:hypothetical protein
MAILSMSIHIVANSHPIAARARRFRLGATVTLHGRLFRYFNGDQSALKCPIEELISRPANGVVGRNYML